MTYTHVLRFLARAILVYESFTSRRAFSTLWKIDEVFEFKKIENDLTIKVEINASNCDRTVNI